MIKKILKFLGTCILLFALFIACIFVKDLIIKPALSSDAPTTEEEKEEKKEEKKEDVSKLIADDKYVTIYYKSLKSTMLEGELSLSLDVTNNSDKQIFVTPIDCYVNDYQTPVVGAMPMIIEPNKKSATPFGLLTGSSGIKTVEDVEKLEFKVQVFDNSNLNSLEKTTPFSISLK